MISPTISFRYVRLAFAFALVGPFTAAMTGCGNSLAKVDGLVQVDGQPLAGGENVRATIYFYPEGGSGAPAIGLLNSDGRYDISTGSKTGIQPGAYVVTISATQIVPAKQVGEAPTGRPLTAQSTPTPGNLDFGSKSNRAAIRSTSTWSLLNRVVARTVETGGCGTLCRVAAVAEFWIVEDLPWRRAYSVNHYDAVE